MAEQENQMYMTAKPCGVEYHFYLDFAIEGSEPFYDFFGVLREASPEDLVFLHINSPGGSLDTATQIINSIQNTQATVVGCAEGEVASAAAYIFFSCHAFQIAEHCGFLVHSASAGVAGKVSDISAEVTFASSRMKSLINSTLGQFFTKKEMKKLMDGREHFLSGEEVAERISKAMDKAQEEQE